MRKHNPRHRIERAIDPDDARRVADATQAVHDAATAMGADPKQPPPGVRRDLSLVRVGAEDDHRESCGRGPLSATRIAQGLTKLVARSTAGRYTLEARLRHPRGTPARTTASWAIPMPGANGSQPTTFSIGTSQTVTALEITDIGPGQRLVLPVLSREDGDVGPPGSDTAIVLGQPRHLAMVVCRVGPDDIKGRSVTLETSGRSANDTANLIAQAYLAADSDPRLDAGATARTRVSAAIRTGPQPEPAHGGGKLGLDPPPASRDSLELAQLLIVQSEATPNVTEDAEPNPARTTALWHSCGVTGYDLNHDLAATLMAQCAQDLAITVVTGKNT